jgi:hypothetical protein
MATWETQRVKNVFDAYSSLRPNGRVSTIISNTHLGSAAIATGTSSEAAAALSATIPVTANRRFANRLKNDRELISKSIYRVGYFGNSYEGWRKVTREDWSNIDFQTKLIEDHQRNGGWDLLDALLRCNSALVVDSGIATTWLCIELRPKTSRCIYSIYQTKEDGIYQEITDKYIAQSADEYSLYGDNPYFDTFAEPWLDKPPTPTGDKWRIHGIVFDSDPCLFVRDDKKNGGTRRTKKKRTRRNKSTKHRK